MFSVSRKDLHLITDNCIRYNGAQSFYGTEARQLRRQGDAAIDAFLLATSAKLPSAALVFAQQYAPLAFSTAVFCTRTQSFGRSQFTLACGAGPRARRMALAAATTRRAAVRAGLAPAMSRVRPARASCATCCRSCWTPSSGSTGTAWRSERRTQADRIWLSRETRIGPNKFLLGLGWLCVPPTAMAGTSRCA